MSAVGLVTEQAFPVSRAVRKNSSRPVLSGIGSTGPDKETMMPNLETMNSCNTFPQLATTLWHCDRCSTFVSIHSPTVLCEALCPACCDVLLEFCGKFNSMPGIQFGDA